MMKHCLLASTILAGVLALSVPASAITVGGAALKSQSAINGPALDPTLLIQVRGKGGKGGKNHGARSKNNSGADDGDDNDDDQGDDNDDQGDDDQGDNEQ
jgi:hypothetical protein